MTIRFIIIFWEIHMMFLIQMGTTRSVILGSIGITLLIIPLGYPILSYLESEVFDWFTYLFLDAHAAFFILTYIFTISFFGFANDNYFSLFPEESLDSLRKVWNIVTIIILFCYLMFFLAMLIGYQQHEMGSVNSESAEISIYGKIFSEGLIGFLLLLLFVYMGTMLSQAVCIVAFLYLGILKYGITETTATFRRWESWIHPFIVNLIWILVFALTFPYSWGFTTSIFVVVILVCTAFAYPVFLYAYRKLKVRPPNNLEELERSMRMEYDDAKKITLFKNLGFTGIFLTFILLVYRFFTTPKHFLDNPIFLSVVTILIVGRTVFEYKSINLQERSLGEAMLLKQKTYESDFMDIHDILAFKFSHYFVLSFLEKNSPSNLKTIGKIYPNSMNNLKVTVEYLVKKGLIEKRPNLERMNKKVVLITEEGLKVLEKIRKYLSSSTKDQRILNLARIEQML